MQDSVCLITGATSGIGRATAHEMANRGWTVAVVGRDGEKCDKTVRSIIQNTGNPHVDFLVADLSAQKDIHTLAGQVRERYSRLNVLINNAGTIAWKRQLSPDGIELTFALNHLGYFLLTNLMLDVLQASAPSRIINVSSSAHMGAEIDLEDIQKSKRYRWREAYGQSKLANLMFTYELARRLEDTGVDVNALHPGLVATNLPANGKLPIGWISGPVLRLLLALKGRSVTQGARTVVYLATAEEVAGASGKYYVNERESPSSAISYDIGVARELWEMSCKLTGLPS